LFFGLRTTNLLAPFPINSRFARRAEPRQLLDETPSQNKWLRYLKGCGAFRSSATRQLTLLGSSPQTPPISILF
jgi:hypothetical protein